MPPRKHLLCLYPFMEIGGADKFNLDLLGRLRAANWTATVVTTLPSRNAWQANFAAVSERWFDLAEFPPEERPEKLVELATSIAPTAILISHSHAAYRLLPFLRARLPGIPLIDYNHMVEMTWGDGGFPRLSATQAPFLDRHIVSSEQLKRWLISAGVETDRIDVCTTNIDPAAWDPRSHDRAALRDALRIPREVPVALFAGRLVRQKQPLVAADVMRQVIAQAPDMQFLVAGDGPYLDYLRGFCRYHRLEKNVHLLGPVSNRRIQELLALSDIFFLPSAMEGISLAIFEAMAMRAVPVGADVGGQSELVTPDCGLLIKPGPNEVADYTRALLGLLRDQPKLRQMGTAARQRVSEHFRLDQMGEQMERAILRAAELHQFRPKSDVNAATADRAAQAAILAARQSEIAPRENLEKTTTWRSRCRQAVWRWLGLRAWWLVRWMENIRGRWRRN